MCVREMCVGECVSDCLCVCLCRLFNVLNVLILFSYFSKNVELFHDLRHSRILYPGRELCCKMVKVGENRKIEQTKNVHTHKHLHTGRLKQIKRMREGERGRERKIHVWLK